MKLNQRSRGAVDGEYFPAKAALERQRRKGFCMICQKPLVKGDKNSGRKYHHDCWDLWFAQYRPPMLWADFRERALKRDHHKCVKCGRKYGDRDDKGFIHTEFVVDHIQPIALGGAEFDMDNLQTLCWECNKKKTHEDIKLIAATRRAYKLAERTRQRQLRLQETAIKVSSPH